MRRWLIPSLAAHQFHRARMVEVFSFPGTAKRNAIVTNLASIQHEEVEVTMVLSQVSAATSGPLAMNRYRR